MPWKEFTGYIRVSGVTKPQLIIDEEKTVDRVQIVYLSGNSSFSPDFKKLFQSHQPRISVKIIDNDAKLRIVRRGEPLVEIATSFDLSDLPYFLTTLQSLEFNDVTNRIDAPVEEHKLEKGCYFVRERKKWPTKKQRQRVRGIRWED